jgi:hypothetical protein
LEEVRDKVLHLRPDSIPERYAKDLEDILRKFLEKDPIFRPRLRNVLKMLLIKNNRAEVLELRD